MKIIDLEQGSQDWIDWRKKKVTASEIPIIIGKSKWCTPLQLWKRKLGFAEGQIDNFAMQRGRELEPIIREMVNMQLCSNYRPAVVQSDSLDWAIASLDGIDFDKNSILEIKTASLQDQKTAEQGKVPDHYWAQVQWQLFCSELETGHYASYHDEKLEIVEFNIDYEYICDYILPKANEFYRRLLEQDAPDHQEDEHIQVTDPQFREYSQQWKSAHEMAKHWAEKEKYFKEKLISLTDDGNCFGFGVKLTRVDRNGSIDWEAFLKDASIKFPDLLEKCDPKMFRKKQIGYWKISLEA